MATEYRERRAADVSVVTKKPCSSRSLVGPPISFSGSGTGRTGVVQSEDDRRRYGRFRCGGEAEIRSLASSLCAKGRVANLSLSGCLIELNSNHGFHRGEVIEMTFRVRQLPLRVQGSIRQAHSGPLVGVEFTVLTERGKRQLLELIKELAAILQLRLERPAQAQR
jgi:hypothetical protein